MYLKSNAIFIHFPIVGGVTLLAIAAAILYIIGILLI